MLEMHSLHVYMFDMNWGAFDLNLLIVFDAVMQERSVTRAGSRIGLSQPAMSHALNRLRYMLKDELFVRTPDGMTPTARAELLAQPLRNALSEMQLALEPAAFDPAASDRRFALAVNNYAAVVLAPPLVAAVSAAAPGVRLDLRPSGSSRSWRSRPGGRWHGQSWRTFHCVAASRGPLRHGDAARSSGEPAQALGGGLRGAASS
jgi:hypothetical protein